ncbi:DUF4232 domain-containing protein [Streptomyces sp. NPDC017936]|uniref:DUF4232 domain-containing protein n=1 Tax=Streptomyces sp. NPDC017936 TaxID=3365016 RepID=UPI003792AE09
MSTVRRAAVALTAVAALALTGCETTEDGAAGAAGTTPAASPSASAASSGPSRPSPPPQAPSTTPPGSAAGGSSGGGGASPAEDHVFPCSTHDVTFTATLAEPTTSSYLLKITNIGAEACRALGHPVVTFGDLDGQATERGEAPGVEDALRLAPGESAYAGLMGGADDGRGRTVGSIAMTMNTESDLEQTPLEASTPGLYVSPDTNSVTPWVNNAEDALSL